MHAIPLFANDATDLSKTVEFVRALIILNAKASAYYYMFVSSDIIWTRKIPTAATDGIYLYFNPEFFQSLPSDSQRAFLMGHEVGHIVLRHPARGRFYSKRGFFTMSGATQIPYYHTLYNQSADYVINADLVAHGLEFIPCGLLDSAISRDDVVDSVYMTLVQEKLEEEKKKEEEKEEEGADADKSETTEESADCAESEETSGSDESEAGDEDSASDAGDDATDDGDDDGAGESGEEPEGDDQGEEAGTEGEGGAGDDASDPLEGSTSEGHDTHLEPKYEGTDDECRANEQEDKEEIQRKVDQALDTLAEAHSNGSGQAKESGVFAKSGSRYSADAASSTDWRGELADYVTRMGGQGESSWRRIHRRRWTVLDLITPSYLSTFDRMAFSIDISYSVDRPALLQAVAEMARLIDELQPASGCVVLFTNTKVVEVHEVFSGADLLDLDIPAGGGTYMPAAVQWLEAEGLEVDVHICFTDGYFDEEDWVEMAEAGAIVVLDHYSEAYIQRYIDAAGTRVIVASDTALAA
tara:strand:+ start:955 stop:2532 length:1578 start_codon:yes stop_codon:yes gene_type:complete